MGGQGGSAGSGAGPVTRGEDEDDEGDISLTCTSQSDSWHSAPRCSVSLLAAPDCHNGPQWRGAYIGRAVLDAASHRFGEHMAVGRLLADVGTCPGKVRGVPPPVCWLGARGQCDAGREQNEGNQRQLDDNMA